MECPAGGTGVLWEGPVPRSLSPSRCWSSETPGPPHCRLAPCWLGREGGGGLGRGVEQKGGSHLLPELREESWHQQSGGGANSCPVLALPLTCFVSLGNLLLVSELVCHFLLPGPGAGLIPPGSVQSPGQRRKEKKSVSRKPFHPRASGLGACSRPSCPLPHSLRGPRWTPASCAELGTSEH